jgi:hypothetical protein
MVGKRDVSTASGNDVLRREIEAYWRSHGYVVKTTAIKAVDMKHNPVYGIRSDLGMYLPRKATGI